MTNEIRTRFLNDKPTQKLQKDAAERVEVRIVGLSLLAKGQEGAETYLRKFGKGISAPKCAALAIECERRAELDAASEAHYRAFAQRFWEEAERLSG